VRAALAAASTSSSSSSSSSTSSPAAPLPSEPLPRALAMHVRLTAPTVQPSAAQLVDLARAWSEAVDAARDTWAARARSRGVLDAAAVTRGVEDTVVASLAAALEPLDLSGLVVVEQPPLLVRAIDQLRTARLDALEIAVAAIAHRLDDVADADAAGDGAAGLSPVGELREWAALRALYEAVARLGTDGRRLAWQAAQSTVCEQAVRLWNVRREHRLSNAMNRWLRDETRRVGDARALETHEANVACGV
jgi:hypothetical protein